jgi:hypothetical protein
MKPVILVALVAVLLLGSTGRASADPFIVDQSQTLTLFSDFLVLSGSYGQSFTPSLPSVHDVEIPLGISGIGVPPPTVTVNIRSGSIGGPILGSSAPTAVVDIGSDPLNPIPTHFDLLSSVPLTPGTQYFIEFFAPGYLVPDQEGFPYPGGTEFGDGIPVPTNSLWFREGPAAIAIPEPSSPALLGLGAAALAGWRLRRRKPATA